jgi:predicted permease
MKYLVVFILLLFSTLNTKLMALWVQTNGPCEGTVKCFAVGGTNLYAGAIGCVYRSVNNGANWTSVNNGLPVSSYVNALAVSGANIFAGINGSGVFLSTNSGTSWTVVNNGLTNPIIYALAVYRNNLFAGTYGSSVWKQPLSEFTNVTEEVNNLLQGYTLSQNYPNPFNPNTVISYSLPSASDVKLIVYNSLGQTVNLIDHGFKPAGNYSANFNASDLPSGIYFYKLKAGQFSQIKKMIVLK